MQSKTYEQICDRCRRVCLSEEEFRDHECFDMNAKIEFAIAQAKQKTLQAGIIIGADESLLIVRPNAYDFTLEELQGFVGGYIKLAILKTSDLHGTLVVNENSAHHQQKTLKRNRRATTLAALEPGEEIRGDAVLVLSLPGQAHIEAAMLELLRQI